MLSLQNNPQQRLDRPHLFGKSFRINSLVLDSVRCQFFRVAKALGSPALLDRVEQVVDVDVDRPQSLPVLLLFSLQFLSINSEQGDACLSTLGNTAVVPV